METRLCAVRTETPTKTSRKVKVTKTKKTKRVFSKDNSITPPPPKKKEKKRKKERKQEMFEKHKRPLVQNSKGLHNAMKFQIGGSVQQ